MTDINHHLSDAMLMAYAAGTLPEAFSLVVATHVSMCDDCRARSASYDMVGGAMLEELAETAAMEDGSFAAALRKAKAAPEAPQRAKPAPAAGGVLPRPLSDYVGGDIEAIRWRPVGMGVKQAILATSSEATARLLFIPAGAAMPDHGHGGTELTLVLKGAFEDGEERFARGDVETASEDHYHTPVADVGEDCICLAATDAPLRFKGLIPRLVQPFLKI